MPRVSGRSRTATAGSPSKLLCGFLWRTHRAEQRRTIFPEATAELGSCQGGSGSQLLRPVRGHAWLACAALFVMTSILHVPSPTMSGDVRGPSPVWGPVWGLGSKVARKAWSDSWSGIGLWLQGVQPLFFSGVLARTLSHSILLTNYDDRWPCGPCGRTSTRSRSRSSRSRRPRRSTRGHCRHSLPSV